MLKEDLWSSLQLLEPEAVSAPLAAATNPGCSLQPGLSFQNVISNMDSLAAASQLQQPDVSVHLCFICMLHLANEHGLQITGVPSLDRMSVVMPV